MNNCQHDWMWVDRAPKRFMFYSNVMSDIYVCRQCQFEHWEPIRPLEEASTEEWDRVSEYVVAMVHRKRNRNSFIIDLEGDNHDRER